MIRRSVTWLIALVWLVNGLFCKVLALVPRHRLIVARILGPEHAGLLTAGIGVGEIGLAVWIASRWRLRLAAWVQLLLVAVMNVLEFLLAPDLLLFGRANILFASVFMALVYANAFPPGDKLSEEENR